MEIPNFNLKELIECGVHFGHKTQKWNPKMEQYIHSVRENVHIIDLTQTMGMLSTALDTIQKTVAKGGKILFVATNKILPPFATVFWIVSKAVESMPIV